nr:23S rRNA (adenine(2030)-N(6))-methyltransferase RlmJ [Neisseria sicca]
MVSLLEPRRKPQTAGRTQKNHADNYLHAELHVHTPRSDGFGMHGSGMFIINPPYMLAEQLQNNLPELSKILAQDAGAHYVLESKTK